MFSDFLLHPFIFFPTAWLARIFCYFSPSLTHETQKKPSHGDGRSRPIFSARLSPFPPQLRPSKQLVDVSGDGLILSFFPPPPTPTLSSSTNQTSDSLSNSIWSDGRCSLVSDREGEKEAFLSPPPPDSFLSSSRKVNESPQ